MSHTCHDPLLKKETREWRGEPQTHYLCRRYSGERGKEGGRGEPKTNVVDEYRDEEGRSHAPAPPLNSRRGESVTRTQTRRQARAPTDETQNTSPSSQTHADTESKTRTNKPCTGVIHKTRTHMHQSRSTRQGTLFALVLPSVFYSFLLLAGEKLTCRFSFHFGFSSPHSPRQLADRTPTTELARSDPFQQQPARTVVPVEGACHRGPYFPLASLREDAINKGSGQVEVGAARTRAAPPKWLFRLHTRGSEALIP